MNLRSTQIRLLAALTVAALLLVGFLLWNQQSSRRESSEARKASGQEEFRTFRDEQAGFSVQYPRSWRALRSDPSDPQVKLVVGPVGARDYLRVRVVPLPQEVKIDAKTPQEELNALQSELDKFIDGAPGVTKVLERSRIHLNDLPGWYYLYEFTDPTTGNEGVHSHFFLFDGAQMDVLVFQAVPASDFRTLSGTFDRMLWSFQSLRRPAPPPAVSSPAVPPPPAPPAP